MSNFLIRAQNGRDVRLILMDYQYQLPSRQSTPNKRGTVRVSICSLSVIIGFDVLRGRAIWCVTLKELVLRVSESGELSLREWKCKLTLKPHNILPLAFHCTSVLLPDDTVQPVLISFTSVGTVTRLRTAWSRFTSRWIKTCLRDRSDSYSISMGLVRSGITTERHADHAPPSRVDNKNVWS
jgi:hypothetical protein